MDGYLGDPEKTAETIRDGRLHTGDLGRMDEQGRLFITGRASELIISGGFNIFPSEVEAALLATGAVGEACVFGAQDLDWGERVGRRDCACGRSRRCRRPARRRA
ncbi:MAG: AMP-binding protein [Oceanicaulis sp.]|nr:AMP-binding protein [Oceanicaulis sp.]